MQLVKITCSLHKHSQTARITVKFAKTFRFEVHNHLKEKSFRSNISLHSSEIFYKVCMLFHKILHFIYLLSLSGNQVEGNFD